MNFNTTFPEFEMKTDIDRYRIGQTNGIRRLTQLSTTFMFTPKPSSKQKHMKTTQKHEAENAVRGSSRESSIFHPKTQSLISKHPNSFQKFAYRFIYIKDTLKLCRTCNKTSITTYHNNNSALILIIIHDPSNSINDLNLPKLINSSGVKY